MIIFTRYFLDKEYKKLKKIFSINEIAASIKRFSKGLKRKGETELSKFGLKGVKVVKLHVGKGDKGRLIFMQIVVNNYSLPILIRKKSNKKTGYNISVQTMEKELIFLVDKVLMDYKNKDYEVFDE